MAVYQDLTLTVAISAPPVEVCFCHVGIVCGRELTLQRLASLNVMTFVPSFVKICQLVPNASLSSVELQNIFISYYGKHHFRGDQG
jgi:hypothetical protein